MVDPRAVGRHLDGLVAVLDRFDGEVGDGNLGDGDRLLAVPLVQTESSNGQ